MELLLAGLDVLGGGSGGGVFLPLALGRWTAARGRCVFRLIRRPRRAGDERLGQAGTRRGRVVKERIRGGWAGGQQCAITLPQVHRQGEANGDVQHGDGENVDDHGRVLRESAPRFRIILGHADGSGESGPIVAVVPEG